MRILTHPKRFMAAIAAGMALPISAGFANGLPPLRVGMIPDAGATQVSIEQKAPLQKYLSEKLGRLVELIIPTNYNATVEALGNGSLDIAYLGGLTYVKAHERYGAVPLVQRDIDQQFHALFITRAGSGITRLSELRGKNFCFGDINSTSGHLIPSMVLKQAGVPTDSGLKSFRYTGSHPATAQGVATGVCDAGAIDETVYAALVEQGKIAPGTVKVFYTSQPFADYVWVGRKDLGARDRAAFVQAMLALHPGHDDQVLDILRGKKFVIASDASYRNVALTAKALGLL